MSRLFILAAIILAAIAITARRCRPLPFLPFDDGPPVLWIDDDMGEPWAVIATGPGWGHTEARWA